MDFFASRDEFISVLSNAIKIGSSAQASEFLLQHVQSKYNGKLTEQEALKGAFRSLLEQLVKESAKKQIAAIENSCVVTLLDLVFAAAQHELVPTQVPLYCLDDLFESQTASECSLAFKYVEGMIMKLKEEYLSKEDHRYIFVKTCNTLLKRLSKCCDLQLCSRILLCLAHSLPLSEKSGVNKKGSFNLENTTSFEKSDDVSMSNKDEKTAAADAYKTDDADVYQTDDAELHVNYNFYKRFWEFQSYLHDATKCVVNAAATDSFIADATSILDVFSSYSFSNTEEAAHMRSLSNKEFFFTKFLTSSKLIGLQLKDIYFRRHILVQIIIVTRHLLDAIDKSAATVTPAQKEKINGVETAAKTLLSKIPPNGARFGECIEKMMKREAHWIAWKREGCPPFERLKDTNAMTDDQPVSAPKRQRTIAKNNKERYVDCCKLVTDSSKLMSQLEQCPALPGMDEYLAGVQEDIDFGLDEDAQRNSDMRYVWKGLRLVSKHRVESLFKATAEQGRLKAVIADINLEKQEEEKKEEVVEGGTQGEQQGGVDSSEQVQPADTTNKEEEEEEAEVTKDEAKTELPKQEEEQPDNDSKEENTAAATTTTTTTEAAKNEDATMTEVEEGEAVDDK